MLCFTEKLGLLFVKIWLLCYAQLLHGRASIRLEDYGWPLSSEGREKQGREKQGWKWKNQAPFFAACTTIVYVFTLHFQHLAALANT